MVWAFPMGLPRPRASKLLADAVARAPVALEIDVIAYSAANGSHMRLTDRALRQLADSSPGRPFLRDHLHDDATATAGTIERAAIVTADEGAELRMTIRVTQPAAVERVLRGLCTAFEARWAPLTPATCSACRTAVFSTCRHMPGDLSAAGEPISWHYTDVDLLEVSEVLISAMGNTRLLAVREALPRPTA